MRPLLLAAALLASSFLHAQRVSAVISPVDKDVFPDGAIVRAGNYLVGYDEGKVKGRFMGIGFDGTVDKLGAIIYDTNMTALKAIPLTEAANNHGPLLSDIQVVNNIPYIIYHEVRDKMGLGNIMAIPINLTDRSAGKSMIIGNVEQAGFKFKYGLFSYKGFTYKFYRSPDGNRQLVLVNAEDGACFMSVLDQDMKVLWTAANLFDKKEKVYITSACIDNTGKVHLAIQRDIKDGADMRLVPVTKGNREQDIMLEVPNASRFAPELLLTPNKPNSIEIAGITVTDKGRANGIFRTSFDMASRKVSTPVLLPFSDSLMAQLDKDNWANKDKSSKKFGVEAYVIPSFQVQADGTLAGIAELEQSKSGERGSFYFYGPILYFNFHGDKGSFTRIPKLRVSTVSDVGANGMGYMMGNETVVFYNDKASSLERDLSEPAQRSDKYNDHVLIAAIIQPNGKMHREVAVDLKDEDYLARPTAAIALSANKWLIPFIKIKSGGRVGSSERWAIVTIK